MFHEISAAFEARMRELEQIDARDRKDGTPQSHRLRQISPELGRFLAIMLASAPAGRAIEIGTSAGYSTLWLLLACRETGRKITTFEISAHKAALARETFEATGATDVIELICGDALDFLPGLEDIAFCFLDAEKDVYQACYDAVIPKMRPGGLLIADNAISHQTALQPVIDGALRDQRVDAVVVPIGKGELLCRKRSLA